MPLPVLSSLALLILLLLATPAGAQLPDIDIKGDISVSFSSVDGGNYTRTGLSFQLTKVVQPRLIDIGLSSMGRDGAQHDWNNPGVWNGISLTLATAIRVFQTVSGGPALSWTPLYTQTHPLANLGPTEQNLDITPVVINFGSAALNVPVGATIPLKFNVTLDAGGYVVMNQEPVVLENLTVQAGARVVGTRSLQTRQNLVNHGFFQRLGGQVVGDFVNDAPLTAASGAEVTDSLRVTGSFTNTGGIAFSPTASLNRDVPTVNHGTFRMNGATLSLPAGLTNEGTLEGYGEYRTQLVQNGVLTANAPGQVLTLGGFDASCGVTNNATLSAGGGGTLMLYNAVVNQTGGASLHAADGGVVDLNYVDVNGGSLTASGSGCIRVSYWGVLTQVRNEAPVLIMSSQGGLRVVGGAFVNNNTITVNANQGPRASLEFLDPVSVTGVGEIVMKNGTLQGPAISLGTNQRLSGWGQVTASLASVEDLAADVSSQALAIGGYSGSRFITAAVGNNGVMRALNGGTLTSPPPTSPRRPPPASPRRTAWWTSAW